MIRVGIHHCNAAVFHQLAEQAELGGEVILETRMIIEMITRDVGEAGRRNLHAVQAVLIQAMARGLERQMVDAFILQPCELGVEPHWIGRGVAERNMPRRRVDSDRAEARREPALKSPYLAQERSDGG